MGISSSDFLWMLPREYQLVVEKFIDNKKANRKFDNADVSEAIRISCWHLKNTNLNYEDFKKNHFPLKSDNNDVLISKEVVTSEDYLKEKDNISKLHQQIHQKGE